MKRVSSLLVCFGLFGAMSPVFGQPSNTTAEPQLGPIVPLIAAPYDTNHLAINNSEPELGPIVLIAALAEFDTPIPGEIPNGDGQYLPASEVQTAPRIGNAPIRVIYQRAAAPAPEPFPLSCPPGLANAPHPDQIQDQLTSVAEQLAVAGLPEEAAKIRNFQEYFQHEHYQHLLIAFKESQLHSLQAEIDFLKRCQQASATDAQICLHFRVVELNEIDGDQMFANSPIAGCKDFDSVEIQRYVDELCERGSAKILAEPDATVLDGRNVLVQLNEKYGLVPTIASVGSLANPGSFRGPGFSLLASPKLMDHLKLRIGLVIENSEPNSDAEVSQVSGLSTTRLSTAYDIPAGRTLCVVFNPQRSDSEGTESETAKSLLVLLTPEIVRSGPPREIPPSPSGVAGNAFPVRMISRPLIIEAKAKVEQ